MRDFIFKEFSEIKVGENFQFRYVGSSYLAEKISPFTHSNGKFVNFKYFFCGKEIFGFAKETSGFEIITEEWFKKLLLSKKF